MGRINKFNVLVRAAVYDTHVDANGVETEFERMTIGGRKITGREAYFTARKGPFPNFNYTLTYREAYDYLILNFFRAISDHLRNGEVMRLVKKKSWLSKYDDLKSGDIVYEEVYDICYKKGSHYTADGATRYRFEFVKA